MSFHDLIFPLTLPSFLALNDIPLSGCTIVYFYVLAIIKKITINICVHILYENKFSIPLAQYQGTQLLYCMLRICFILWETASFHQQWMRVPVALHSLFCIVAILVTGTWQHVIGVSICISLMVHDVNLFL
jgi:hypothetical protein